ncbi:unnamed protein product [Heterobilharzia americana]|nr:unnamed protein product [Heterobilharzia americana]
MIEYWKCFFYECDYYIRQKFTHMNYQIGCYALFTCKDNITTLRNSTLNVTQIVNPVKSVSLHFCRSARKINDSDPNSTIPLGNRSLLFHHIPIGHLIPKHHELKAISINFDAKCLPKGIPYGKEIKVSKAPQQLNASNVTNGLSNSTVTEGQHEKVESHQSGNTEVSRKTVYNTQECEDRDL